jgi:tRNA G46 methylase TrmB
MTTNADALKQAGEILKELGTANDDKNFLAVSVFLNKLAKVYDERDEKGLM